MIKKKAVTKKSTQKTPAKKDELDLQIVQTSKCQTVSNKSTLTYNVGTNDEDNIFIRINGNTGGGFFSNEQIRTSIN